MYVCMNVTLLPEDLFSLAIEVIEAYEEGELCSPENSKQRQGREVTSSSFNSLRELDPLKDKDKSLIERHLKEWTSAGVRPDQSKPKTVSTITERERMPKMFQLYLVTKSFSMTMSQKRSLLKLRVVLK